MLSLRAEDASGGNAVSLGSGRSIALVLTNEGTRARTLRPGTPVREEEIDGNGPTSVYLAFGDLLDAGALHRIAIAAAGWTAHAIGDSWVLVPDAPGKLAAGDAVRIELTAMDVPGQPRVARITADVFNLLGGDDDAVLADVVVQQPPAGGKALRLLFGVPTGETVYITEPKRTPVPNRFVLHLANPSPSAPIVPPGTSSEGAAFTLTFVAGKRPGYGALATREALAQMQVKFDEIYADRWKLEPDTESDPPRWTLRPLSDEILGTHERASIDLEVTGLVCGLMPGSTQVYLQYAGVPGYDDGYVTCELRKELPKPGILSFFSETPELIDQGEPVRLTWRTFAVDRLELSYQLERRRYLLSTEGGAIGFDGTFAPDPQPYEDTTFHLDAYAGGRKVDAREVRIEVTPQPPRIRSFTRSPDAWVDDLNQPAPIELRWDVTNALRLEIDGHGPVTGRGTTIAVRGARTFTLRAYGTKNTTDSATTPPVRSLQDGLCRSWSGRRQGQGTYGGSSWWATLLESLNFYPGQMGMYVAQLSWGGWYLPPELQMGPAVVYPFEWRVEGDVVTLRWKAGSVETSRLRLEEDALTWLDGGPLQALLPVGDPLRRG